ncbi:MAG: transposase [Gammaproteobacteria bacterium]|uniref:IS66 family insertion sequence element accessory protein TnpB n=1 Tax=Methylotuvimicrobium sp. TaxID=2822413 RepID=UPI001DFACB8D|nr:transposase [Gammaproteobacteria bacterium]
MNQRIFAIVGLLLLLDTNKCLAVESVDMRRGIDGLSAIVQQRFSHAPCAGAALPLQVTEGKRSDIRTISGFNKRCPHHSPAGE